MILSLYSRLMCRVIWTARRLFPASEIAPEENILHRDWEWTSRHVCENCGHNGKHTFIEWMPEQVVTATCGRCGFEGTLT